MLQTRSIAQRRTTWFGLAAALLLFTFFAMPQGQAFASAVLLLFRGQSVQGISTSYSNLKNAYATLEELHSLGSLQGTVPTKLNTVSSVSAAASMAGFTPAQPSAWPTGISHTTSQIQALGPTQVVLTLQKTTADAYFKSKGFSNTLPSLYDGQQLIVNFPGVTVLEYGSTAGGGRLYVGQAGQLVVNTAGNATVTQVRDYLLTLPGLSSETINDLKNITAWQTTLPLGIPTDRAGWTSASVGGSFAGNGVLLNDNTGLGSALLWQKSNGLQSLGVGGLGLKASDVQSVAGSLH